MKVQLIQKGGRYFLRKYFLGIIPLYFDNGYEGGWSLVRSYLSEDEGLDLIVRIKRTDQEQKKFNTSPEKIIATYP